MPESDSTTLAVPSKPSQPYPDFRSFPTPPGAGQKKSRAIALLWSMDLEAALESPETVFVKKLGTACDILSGSLSRVHIRGLSALYLRLFRSWTEFHPSLGGVDGLRLFGLAARGYPRPAPLTMKGQRFA